jgi:hypothetical protein
VVLSPLLSGISGTVGKQVTFGRNRSGYYVHEAVSHLDGASSGQLEQRALFQEAVSAWHDLSVSERMTYTRRLLRGSGTGEAEAEQRGGLTAYQLFLSNYLQGAALPALGGWGGGEWGAGAWPGEVAGAELAAWGAGEWGVGDWTSPDFAKDWS